MNRFFYPAIKIMLFICIIFLAAGCGGGGSEGLIYYGSVQGTVTDSNGGYLEGVLVQIEDVRALTDSHGGYTLNNVPTGNQTIIGEKPGYQLYTGTVNIEPGGVTIKNFEMTASGASTTGTVTGTVSKVSGGALSEVVVTINNLSATTDSNGSYTIRNVESGLQPITGEKEGYKTYSSTVDVQENQIVIKNFEMTPQ